MCARWLTRRLVRVRLHRRDPGQLLKAHLMLQAEQEQRAATLERTVGARVEKAHARIVKALRQRRARELRQRRRQHFA